MINNTTYNLIEITQFLAGKECTYNDAEYIISLLQDWIKQSRENHEYETISDYRKGNKTVCMDNQVVIPMNHVDGFI